MGNFAKSIVGILGLPFAILVLAFTGMQTWNLLYEVSGDPVIATIGLILFEGGMLYWWLFFRKEAEGLPQMALSLIGAVIGLLLVAGATALHLGAVDGDVLGAHTPARLVTIAALVNLVLKFTIPLVHPDQFETIMSNALEGTITLKGYKRAEARVDEIAENVADRIGLVLEDRIMTQVSTRFSLGDGSGRQPSAIVDSTAKASPTSQMDEARRARIDDDPTNDGVGVYHPYENVTVFDEAVNGHGAAGNFTTGNGRM